MRSLIRLGICASVLWAACQHGPSLPKAVKVDELWSALDLPAAGARPYRVAELRGKVALVTFLATWCFPCLGQLPLMQQLQTKYGDKGFEVVAIGMDLEGTRVLDPLQRQYQTLFPVLMAGDSMRQGQTIFGRIINLPTTFLFGREGAVLAIYAGPPVAEELDQLISRAVSE
jgi:thiol-disulfide isomerase/thioredoxin